MKTILMLPGAVFFIVCVFFFSPPAWAALSRADWGAPQVAVSESGGTWTIAGQKQVVRLDARTLALDIHAQGVDWRLFPSGTNDMIVKFHGRKFHMALADARDISIQPYDTGFKTGVKVTLSGFQHEGQDLDLTLYLTVCLQGANEELVFDTAATEGQAALWQLQWPEAVDASKVDYTVLSNNKGDLLPRNWPKRVLPIRNGSAKDHSVLQSHVIEDWAMSWWGFEKGRAGMMVIVETPDDAAYQFSHPPGGPTVIGPRWRDCLGRFRYMRACRMCFFKEGNYVTMAKRYREYVKNRGLFVSLREKIAKDPVVARLIGTPQARIGILFNQTTNSDRYDPKNHYRLTTFDQAAADLRAMKAAGMEHAIVIVSGWARLGYDRQHPDPLPPAEAAGGWAGMKRLAATCKQLGYPFGFHDQYRDYYTDAPSFNLDFAIHEETTNGPATAFAGSRFGDWKEGRAPFMRHWDGGPQSYLNARFQLGHLEKNYGLIFRHGIHPDGIYIDVIGYVPPDQDFNPEHPTTRSDAMRGEAKLLYWAANNLGFTATEAGSDWVIPFADTVNQSGGVGKQIPVPLYQLVYHDAVLVSFAQGKGGTKDLMRGILYGGVPQVPVNMKGIGAKAYELNREMAALNGRVGLLAMTNHEFLNKQRSRERTTFADGTTVTVDWMAMTVRIKPPLTSAELDATGMRKAR